MNKSLALRMKPEFYEELRAGLARMGVQSTAIDRQIAESIREATALYNGLCPQCGQPSARYVDHERQQGEKGDMPGGWVQYRCSTAPAPGTIRPEGVCDFMVDLVEGEAAS